MFGLLTKFLEKSSDPCSSLLNSTNEFVSDENGNELSTANYNDHIDSSSSSSNGEMEDITECNVTEIDKAYSDLCMELNDPACWPLTLTNKIVEILIEKGPIQNVQAMYPNNIVGKSFSTNYFYRKMANGEKFNREWLLYSPKNDAIFCFCCKLFGKQEIKLVNEGFNDWQHTSENLSRHEKTSTHIENCTNWKNLELNLRRKTTIDKNMQRYYDAEKKRWYQVIVRMISVIQFLAGQSLAFRGCSSRLYEKNNGNFLKLIETIGKFDNIMADHINRVQESIALKTHMPHYLGNRFQNEIIAILATEIRKYILTSIKEAKYFSVILDCTPDAGHVEQITMVFRYVHIQNDEVEVRENFIGFFQADKSTGEFFYDFLIQKLNHLALNIDHMRGQGYDNGSNMSGKHIGLQKRILDNYPRALFMPCNAHTLNLVINDAAKISFSTIDFFQNVSAIYNYFCASPFRWKILTNKIKSLTLKQVSETRWEAKIKAIRPLRHELGKIYDSLLELAEECSTPIARHEAECLAMKIKSYQFISSVIIWHDILKKVDIISKMMQKVYWNISSCAASIKEVLKFFKSIRNDESFENYLKISNELCKTVEAEPQFPAEINVRRRRHRKQFSYEGDEDLHFTAKENFKINFFYTILDTAISSITTRFETLSNFEEIFGFLYNFMNLESEEIKKSCFDLHNKYKDGESCDINGGELYEELISLKIIVKERKQPQELIKYLYKYNLQNSFPNLATSLKLLLTIPISVASGERAFSKLKIIKNYLRTSMTEERLSNLSIMAIESEITDYLKIDEAIEEFAAKKSRRINLCN